MSGGEALTTGLVSQGVPAATASGIARPPVSTVFAAMLGYNPVTTLLAPTGLLTKLPAANVTALTGNTFFPTLISGPLQHGLTIVLTAAAVMSVVGAVVSFLRGKPFVGAVVSFLRGKPFVVDDSPPAVMNDDRQNPGVRG